MVTLPKHLRPRWRYLGIRVETAAGAPIERSAFQTAIWHALRSLLGDVTSARVGLDLMRFDHDGRIGEAIVRVHRGREGAARAALATLSAVDDRPVGVAVIGVSGTIRGCEENYLGLPREAVRQETVVFDGVESRATIGDELVDVEHDSALVGATTLDLI